MAITAAGVGSGLDIESIVSSLMQLERRPLEALERREAGYRAELSAYGQLKSAISTFGDAMEKLGSLDKFKLFSSTSSDEDVAEVTTESSAAPGTFALDIQRLAQNHKMASGEFADTTTFGGAAGDSLTITIGADAMTLDLSSAQTLSQMRDAINSATDNPGVTATIFNTGGGNQRLVLTSNESGYDNRLQLSYGGAINAATFGDGASEIGDAGFETNNQNGGAYITDLTQLDASFTVDGFSVTSASNNVSGMMDGVTFNLKATGTSNINVERDTDAIKETVQGFVDAYNALQSTVSGLQQNRLSGDGSLRSIQNQLRNVINTEPSTLDSLFTSLSQVGIATQKDGTLSLDSSDLTDALDADFAGVAELFANDDQGFAFRFNALADSLLDTDGIIDSREDGLNDRIRSLEDKQLSYEYQLELKEKAMRAQYSALDSLVGSLQATSQFLAQNLG